MHARAKCLHSLRLASRWAAPLVMAEGHQPIPPNPAESSAAKAKVLVIAGTTAVGKTDLSLELAKRLNGEVISADSVQVYRHMNVGSAKVQPSECAGVPHHVLDVVDTMNEVFSVGDYYQLATAALEDVTRRGRVPMVVGGTGLYLQTLMRGPTGSPPSTKESRARIDALLAADEGDWEASLARLRALDPDYAATLKPHNWYYLKRALDICTLSGRTVTSFKKVDVPDSSPYDFCCLFLTMPRVQLFQRIDARCESIVKQGLFQEVVGLVREQGLKLDSQTGRSIGYRQALEYLKLTWGFPSDDERGHQLQIPRGDALRKSFLDFLINYKAKTRQLANKQLVWFRKESAFLWLNMAPGGKRLEVGSVAERVEKWFIDGAPLPEEWLGENLKDLTDEEKLVLKEYSAKHCHPVLFTDESSIDGILSHIEATICEPLQPAQAVARGYGWPD